MDRPLTRNQLAGWNPVWQRLPPELRLVIWEILAASATHKQGFATYSVVSREWQAFFEERLYGYIALHQQDLTVFRALANHRIHIVKHIWLRIEFPRYRCRHCSLESAPLYMADNQREIFRAVLDKLLLILSTWEPLQIADGQGLTLEISTHSPSDMVHSFRNVSILPVSHQENLRQCAELPQINDSEHHWVDGVQTNPPQLYDYYSLFDVPVVLAEQRSPRSVPAVRHLLIRRQTRRYLTPFTLCRILASFRSLETIHLETWRPVDSYLEESQDQSTAPSSLPHFLVSR